MSDIVDKAPSLTSVCMILKFAADHCGKVMLLSGGFFSWLVFNMIWVPPEAPSTISRSSSRTTGRELTKSGISRGRLPLGVVLGSSSFCAGSANSSERPRRIGSPSDSSKALSSSWTAVSDCNAVRVGTVALWPHTGLEFVCWRSPGLGRPSWIDFRVPSRT